MALLERASNRTPAPLSAYFASFCLPTGRDIPHGHANTTKYAVQRSSDLRPAHRRILIVEDEAVVALDISMGLAEYGHEVAGLVATERDAIRKAIELEPDLVIMDIKLKNTGDGIRASQEIIAWRDIPVVFITAFRNQATMSRLEQLEPVTILFKPFNRQALLAAVESALDQHRS